MTSHPFRRRADRWHAAGLLLILSGLALLIVLGYHAALVASALVAVGAVIASTTDKRAGAR